MTDIRTTTYNLANDESIEIKFWPGNHQYAVNGEKGWPSVTGVLGIFDKPALAKWLQKVGFVGAAALYAKGAVDIERVAALGTDDLDAVEWDPIFEAMKRERLRSWDRMNKRGDEGDEAHDAMETYAKTGAPLKLGDFRKEVKPYIQAGANFLLDAEPRIMEAEVLVASPEHRYVGTYDKRFALMKPCALICNAETGEREEYDAGIGLGDYKTGKHVYDEASLQLIAYEGASVECGHNPTDFRMVIHLRKDGKYEVVRCWSEIETFHYLVAAHAALKLDAQHKAEAATKAVILPAERIAA